jgi:aryl-alcohol dehydrogenase-like predicted oxidoreductase
VSDVQLPAVPWRGESIPLLTLGTAQLGLPGYGVANRTSGMEQTQVDAIVAAAWESGVRFFDTAQAYGNSEELLGQAFRNLRLNDADEKPGTRIVTKLAPDVDCKDTKAIIASLELSRVRLDQECLWGVMLHCFAWLAEWDNSLGDALKIFRKQGGVKYLGVSVYEAEDALAAIEHPDMDIIQIPANAWDGRMTRAGVFERARDRDKLLFVRSVFLQGLLLLPPEEAEAKVPGSKIPIEKWREICQHCGLSSQAMALDWASELKTPLVMGAEAPEQIAQAAAVLIAPILSREQRYAIDRIMLEAENSEIIDPRCWTRSHSGGKGHR